MTDCTMCWRGWCLATPEQPPSCISPTKVQRSLMLTVIIRPWAQRLLYCLLGKKEFRFFLRLCIPHYHVTSAISFCLWMAHIFSWNHTFSLSVREKQFYFVIVPKHVCVSTSTPKCWDLGMIQSGDMLVICIYTHSRALLVKCQAPAISAFSHLHLA